MVPKLGSYVDNISIFCVSYLFAVNVLRDIGAGIVELILDFSLIHF